MKIRSQRVVIVVALVIILQTLMPLRAAYALTSPALQEGALSLPDGRVGQSYEYQLGSEGGLPPLTWRVVAGELPPGISLEASGKLRGIPSRPSRESYAFAIEVSDSSQPAQRYSQPFLLMIHAAPLRMVIEPNKLKIVAPKQATSEERKTEPATNIAPASPTQADKVAAEETHRSFRIPTPFLKNSEQWTGSPGDAATMSNTRVRSVKESVAGKQNPVSIKSPFGTYEDFNPARFVRIFEDTKRGDRYLIYEPNRREITEKEQALPRLGEIVARRYSTRIDNKTRTLPTQLAVDVDSSIVIEPIPEAFGPDMPLNKIFMSASLKKSDLTSPLEVKNYAEIAKDQATMAAQKATAFQTAQNIQSVIINLSYTVDDLLNTVYHKDPEAGEELNLFTEKEGTIEDIKERLRFYRPEIQAITDFLLDERNLSVVQIIGNDVFWIDAGSMREIAKQIQKDIALAFDDSIKEAGTKNQAVRDLFERAKLIYRDLKEVRLGIKRLKDMKTDDYEKAYKPHTPTDSYDTRKPRTLAEQQFLDLLLEKQSKDSKDLEYLIEQKAILVYAEKRAELALDYLKKLFTPGYVSLENADAKDGNLLTLTVEARSSDADSGGAAVVFEVAIRSYGAKFHLGPTMMFLNRKGVSDKDGSMLTPINYAPSPGMNFGITWFKRGDSIWNKVLRGLAPGVGVNVSFMNFKDPGFDQLTQKFTNTTGTDVQVGAGPYASFFNNMIDVTTGWNLNVDKKRRYFGFGFEFIDIGKFLKDKLKSTP